MGARYGATCLKLKSIYLSVSKPRLVKLFWDFIVAHTTRWYEACSDGVLLLVKWTSLKRTLYINCMMHLDADNIIKYIFICQMYNIIVSGTVDNTKSVTYDLWNLVSKYNLTSDVMDYFTGGALISKSKWKQFSKTAVLTHEEVMYCDGLRLKQVMRFQRIHSKLNHHAIFDMIRKHMNIRKLLLNVIKLSAFPVNCAECVCEHCYNPYTDTVEHYIMQCQGLVSERSIMWDNVLDQVTCANEVKIMNLDIN